jgi:hypothetical protein
MASSAVRRLGAAARFESRSSAGRLYLSKAVDKPASTVIGKIRAIRDQKSGIATIFFVTLRKIFGRNISERLKLSSQR